MRQTKQTDVETSSYQMSILKKIEENKDAKAFHSTIHRGGIISVIVFREVVTVLRWRIVRKPSGDVFLLFLFCFCCGWYADELIPRTGVLNF